MENVKRISTTLLALSALLLVFVLPASAETVSVDSATVSSGGTATVSIRVTGVTTDITAATVRLTFNPAIVTVQSVSAGDLGAPTTNINNAAGTVDISTFSNIGKKYSEYTIANVVLKGVSTASVGATSPLTLTVTALADSYGVNRVPTITSGTAKISSELISVGSATVLPSGTTTVPIQVTGITTDISAATVRLTYNPAIVTVSDATKGDLTTFFTKNIDNNNGTVIFSTFGNGIATSPVTLANVVLRGVSTASVGATSPLTLTVTTLADSYGNKFGPTITNGIVTIGATTGTVVTIQNAVGSSSISGAANGVIPVSIVAKNVQNLAAATVTLSYDPSVVTVQSVSSGDIGTLTSNVNNNAGTTTISTFSLTGKSGNATIANLELKIVGSTGASTPLTIGVTTLSNSNANPIPYTISNGQLSVIPVARGDMNCDGAVNIIDALLIAQYSVGLRSAPYTC